MLSKITTFLKQNGVYVLMLLGILSTVVFYNAISIPSDSQGKSGTTISQVRETQEKQVLDEAKIWVLISKKPVLFIFFIAVMVMVFLVLGLGVLLFLFLIIMHIREKNIFDLHNLLSPVKWGIIDIFRFIIVIVFISQVYSITEEIVALFSGELYFKDENLVQMINTLIVDCIAVGCVCYFVFHKYGYSLREKAFSIVTFSKKLAVGFSFYLAMLPILFSILLLCFWIAKKVGYDVPMGPIYDIITQEKRSHLLVFFSGVIALIGPVIEEIVFRGFIYRALKNRMSIFWAIIVSAGFFSLLHQNIVSFIPIMLLGALFAYIYEKTGSLLVPITIHAAHNAAILVVSFVFQNIYQTVG